jgi:hypothetical protein
LLDKRLALIASSSRGRKRGGGEEEGMVEMLLKKAWKNYGVQCRGINWQRNSLEEVISISSCISGSTLFVIFSAFAKDYRRYSTGMPDLFFVNR